MARQLPPNGTLAERLADATGHRTRSLRLVARRTGRDGNSILNAKPRPLSLRARQQARALVGHSYGGAVALHVAGLRRDLLRSLTLIEPAAFHLLRGTDAQAFAEITEVATSVERATASGEYLAGFGRFVDYWNGPEAWAGVPAEKRYAMAARLPR
jgi:hypothetical protein